jgi:hypothetical protein
MHAELAGRSIWCLVEAFLVEVVDLQIWLMRELARFGLRRIVRDASIGCGGWGGLGIGQRG